ncbi:MAG: permease [Deltaproteobacteria bacterium]|nr:permease [Deltaproteobacteria bacterium]
MLLKSIHWLVFGVMQLDPGDRFAQAFHFFLYDSIKIFFLLFVMIAVIGFLRTYLPHDKVARWLTKRGGWGNVFAATFGAVTPFCSCSSIPLFLGFLKAGIPLGVTFSFLITSPLINEYLVVLMLGFFGWKITLLYVASGMLIGIVSGMVLGRMRLERFLVPDMVEGEAVPEAQVHHHFKSRLLFGIDEATQIIRKIWIWIFVGVGVGALIHNYVPEEAVQSVLHRAGAFSVPIATLIGVPLYGSCSAVIPIAVALFQKGIPLGTALAFLMGIAALSVPEAIMLRRAMRIPLIATFFGITTLAIIFTGYAFNALQPLLNR